jgi:hypothetical protein
MHTATALLEWCTNALFAFSPEKRRLLNGLRENVRKRHLRESETMAHLTCIKEHSFDRYMIRMLHEYSDSHFPLPIANVLKAAQLAGDPRRLTTLGEIHFTICREIFELSSDRCIQLGSFLSPEAISVKRNSDRIQHYALHNTEDWELIMPLLRDRHLWDFEDAMEALRTVKSVSTAALSEGAL